MDNLTTLAKTGNAEQIKKAMRQYLKDVDFKSMKNKTKEMSK